MLLLVSTPGLALAGFAAVTGWAGWATARRRRQGRPVEGPLTVLIVAGLGLLGMAVVFVTALVQLGN